MRTFLRRISLPPFPDHTLAVHLVFNVTRAQPLLPNLKSTAYERLQPGAFDLAPSAFPNVLTLGMKTGASTLAAERRTVLVQSLGDPPELVRVVARTEEQFFVLQPPTPAPCLSDGDLLLAAAWRAAGPVTSPGGLLFGPAEYAADLVVALAAMPVVTLDEQQKWKRASYFARLNALSDSKLNGFLGALLQPIVNQHVTNGFSGVLARQLHYLKEWRGASAMPPGTALPSFPSATFTNSAAEIAAIFELARTDNLMTVAEVEDAFMAFAQGQLRLQLPTLKAWTTQPSSGFFFLFGEFALLAHECGLGAPWLQLARTLCMVRELYVLAYPPVAGAKLDVEAYVACNYVERVPTPGFIAQLQATFDALGEQDLIRRSARQTDTYLANLPIPP